MLEDAMCTGTRQALSGEACGSSQRDDLRIGRAGSRAHRSDPCTGGHNRPADCVVAAVSWE